MRKQAKSAGTASALILILSNFPTYFYVGRTIVPDNGLISFTYFVVVAVTLAIVTFYEFRKWRARPDSEPNYRPTVRLTNRGGVAVGKLGVNP